MGDCVFCKIVNKNINSKILYEDEHVIAFPDINPISPIHILIIPKNHKTSIMEMKDDELLSLKLAIKEIVKESSIYKNGFRLVNNFGQDGGQEVEHLHFHLIAGRKHSWPPG